MPVFTIIGYRSIEMNFLNWWDRRTHVKINCMRNQERCCNKQQQHNEHNVKQRLFDFVAFGFELANTHIDHILSVRIVEVAQEPSFDTVYEIHDRTVHRSFAQQSEVCLHRRCSRIEHADDISILRPAYPEVFLKLIGESLESTNSLRFRTNTQLREDIMQDVPREDRLHHIGTIETVHTVRTDDAFLTVLACVVPDTSVGLPFDMEVAVVAQLP